MLFAKLDVAGTAVAAVDVVGAVVVGGMVWAFLLLPPILPFPPTVPPPALPTPPPSLLLVAAGGAVGAGGAAGLVVVDAESVAAVVIAFVTSSLFLLFVCLSFLARLSLVGRKKLVITFGVRNLRFCFFFGIIIEYRAGLWFLCWTCVITFFL